ncbi:MAG: UvrB/UvrC motif-containing protein [bacterium]|nr:UvrB/UvrC motif-containing protein [bacterium]
MAKGNKYKFSIQGMPLYPHIKLTRERFPRILATRIIADDAAEYFGAFLNRTNARMLLDFLNRTFRLRSCDINIDGSFNYPCTMHYKRRCIAPCVNDLTDEEEYAEMVGLLRLFLLNDRSLFGSAMSSKITEASNRLDFESAAKWRDILEAVEAYWADARRSPWVDGTSDTFTFRTSDAGLDVVIISQKGTRVLGERIFTYAHSAEPDAGQAISEIIAQFYQFHAPKEIRVSIALPKKDALSRLISTRIGRHVPIVTLTEKTQRVSTDRAVNRSNADLDLKRAIVGRSSREMMQSLRRDLNLTLTPKRITAIDVAHLSGTDQVAAAVSWRDGRIDTASTQSWLSDSSSEVGSLRGFVQRFVAGRDDDIEELIVIDGGPAQLSAAMAADLPKHIAVISAVKPAGAHGSVSHFLVGSKVRVEFDAANEGHLLLKHLRDEAHDYANAIHRDTREFAHYYQLAAALPSITETERRKLLISLGSVAKVLSAEPSELLPVLAGDRAEFASADLVNYQMGETRPVPPLIVPTRLQAADGSAEDLRPIGT